MRCELRFVAPAGFHALNNAMLGPADRCGEQD
jgi:hypothetical protein